MERRYRLRRDFDFRIFFRHAWKKDFIPFKVYVFKNSCGHARFAFVIPRSAEKHSVRRNLIRRRAKEWIRRHRINLTRHHDVVLVFKKEAFAMTRRQFYEHLEYAAEYF